MPTPTNGLGIHNYLWKLLDASEVQQLLDLKGHLTGMLVLAYPDSPVLREKAQQEAQLWLALGKPRFLLRIYAPNIPSTKPKEWARICIDVVKIYQEYGVEVELLGWNEWNIEGGGEEWYEMVEWIRVWVGEIVRELPEVLRHLCALSPQTPNYQKGIHATSSLREYFHFTNLHIYTKEQAADISLIWDAFELPIVITEFNKLKPTQMRSLCYVEVWGHYYYIAGGDEQDLSLHLLRDPELVENFKQASTIEITRSLEASQPTDGGEMIDRKAIWKELSVPYESYPALTKRIVGMGGIPIGSEVIKVVEGQEYICQLGCIPTDGEPDDVVAHCKRYDWGNVQVAHSWEELFPLV